MSTTGSVSTPAPDSSAPSGSMMADNSPALQPGPPPARLSPPSTRQPSSTPKEPPSRPGRVSWVPELEETFFNSLVVSVRDCGYRDSATGILRPEAWQKVQKDVLEKHNVNLERGHYKNKVDNARKKYKMWRSLATHPAFTYDETTHTISAPDSVWDDPSIVDPRARVFKHGPLQYESCYNIIFPDIYQDPTVRKKRPAASASEKQMRQSHPAVLRPEAPALRPVNHNNEVDTNPHHTHSQVQNNSSHRSSQSYSYSPSPEMAENPTRQSDSAPSSSNVHQEYHQQSTTAMAAPSSGPSGISAPAAASAAAPSDAMSGQDYSISANRSATIDGQADTRKRSLSPESVQSVAQRRRVDDWSPSSAAAAYMPTPTGNGVAYFVNENRDRVTPSTQRQHQARPHSQSQPQAQPQAQSQIQGPPQHRHPHTHHHHHTHCDRNRPNRQPNIPGNVYTPPYTNSVVSPRTSVSGPVGSQYNSPTTGSLSPTTDLIQQIVAQTVKQTQTIMRSSHSPPASSWTEKAMDIYFANESDDDPEFQLYMVDDVFTQDKKAMIYCKMAPSLRHLWVAKIAKAWNRS